VTKAPRENRVPIMMSAEELDELDTWRFANKVATRSEAARRLMQIGIRSRRELDGIYDAVRKASFQSVAISQRLGEIREARPLESDAMLFAVEVAQLIIDKLPDNIRAIREAHTRLIDLLFELNAVAQSSSTEEAMRMADEANARGLARRIDWEDVKINVPSHEDLGFPGPAKS
jgi:hypothetical protein